ncbi:MAG TPA: hypothetical protein VKX45_20275 [Bryobacteraceae bacterium]|jgi:hypothetical protein|nr:hypothetical protein [Bryobacteraceae bacterium]
MQSPENPLVLTRRSMLLLAGAGLAWSAEYWEKKPPEQWTRDEIDQLLSKSPWAKQVSAQAPVDRSRSGGNSGQYPGGGYPGGGYPGGGYPGGGMGYPRIAVGGMGRRRGGYPPGGGGMQTRKGTVRWQSAKPILEASKAKLPESMNRHYVIAVSGFPAPSNEDEHLDQLKQDTTIQPKDKPIAGCAVVEKNGSWSDWLFGFSKDTITLAPADKEVEFVTIIGKFRVKAKFNLKEMMYHGELAV